MRVGGWEPSKQENKEQSLERGKCTEGTLDNSGSLDQCKCWMEISGKLSKESHVGDISENVQCIVLKRLGFIMKA